MTNKIHTGYPDCCADCELAFDLKGCVEGKKNASKKRKWFISYRFESYSAGYGDCVEGFANDYITKFNGEPLNEEDIKTFEENMRIHYRPRGGSPDDKYRVIVLNIVEIGAK